MDHTSERSYHAPEWVRVGSSMLRSLLEALDGDIGPSEVEALQADLVHLIAVAQELAWPL